MLRARGLGRVLLGHLVGPGRVEEVQVQEEGRRRVALLEPILGAPADLARFAGFVDVGVEALLESATARELRVVHERGGRVRGLVEHLGHRQRFGRQHVGLAAGYRARAAFVHAVLQRIRAREERGHRRLGPTRGRGGVFEDGRLARQIVEPRRRRPALVAVAAGRSARTVSMQIRITLGLRGGAPELARAGRDRAAHSETAEDRSVVHRAASELSAVGSARAFPVGSGKRVAGSK